MAQGDRAALAGATKAAAYGVVLQVFKSAVVIKLTLVLVGWASIRISSFLLNALVLRIVSGELLGVVNIRLTLLYNTLVFLSREALRNACLSRARTSVAWSKTFNLMWCSVALWVLFAVPMVLLWLSPLLTQPTVPADPQAVVLFAVAALLEVSVEPLWLLAEAFHYTRLKIAGEGLGQMSKVVVVLVGVTWLPHAGLLVFCAGQLAYSLVYVLVYVGYFRHLFARKLDKNLPVASLTAVLPSLKLDKYFDSDQVSLTRKFVLQSMLKMVLTNGEGYVMTFFSVLTFTEQGVFDIISNLGSMAARFVFKPIEESFRVFFARILFRGVPASDQNVESLQLATSTLGMLSKLVVCIALAILCFGLSYSHLALTIYGGDRLTSHNGHSLLQWYCVYVLLLAVNGISECFFFVVMSEEEVNRYNRRLVLFSLVLLSSSWLLTRVMGSAGFIAANCINMAVRIAHRFIHKFYENTNHNIWGKSVLSGRLLVVFGLIAIIVQLSEALIYSRGGLLAVILHITVGTVCLGGLGVAIAITESELLQSAIDHLPTRLHGVARQFVSYLSFG